MKEYKKKKAVKKRERLQVSVILLNNVARP